MLRYLAAAAVGCALTVAAQGAPRGPDLAPDALSRAFDQIGFRIGAVRTIEGVTVRVDDLRVTPDGRWIVVRVLPRRVSAQ